MYKVLTSDSWSPILKREIHGRNFTIKPLHYPVGEWVSGEFGIFICETIADAARFLSVGDCIWYCDTRGARRVAPVSIQRLSGLTRDEVLKEMTFPPYLYVADAIRITERV